MHAQAQRQFPYTMLRVSLIQISRTPVYERLNYEIPYGSVLGYHVTMTSQRQRTCYV
jgi:hypothetical protein